MIKGSAQEQDILLVNIYEFDIGSPKYIKQVLTDIKGNVYSSAIKAEDFDTALTSLDRSSRQKFNKETLALNDTIDRMDSSGMVSGSSARLLLPLASYMPSALQVSASSWQHCNSGEGGTLKGLD